MDEIQNPIKVVPLVGKTENLISMSDEGEAFFQGRAVKGVAVGFLTYAIVGAMFAFCYYAAKGIQAAIVWATT